MTVKQPLKLRGPVFIKLAATIRNFAAEESMLQRATAGEAVYALLTAANDIAKNAGLDDDDRRALFDHMRSVVGTEARQNVQGAL